MYELISRFARLKLRAVFVTLDPITLLSNLSKPSILISYASTVGIRGLDEQRQSRAMGGFKVGGPSCGTWKPSFSQFPVTPVLRMGEIACGY